MEWQPIETAPKDGTPILAAGANLGDPRKGYHQAVVEWTQDKRTPEQIKAECGEDFSGWYYDDDADNRLEFLTHWMPLPPPPPRDALT